MSPCMPLGPGWPDLPSLPCCPRLPSGPLLPVSPGGPVWKHEQVYHVAPTTPGGGRSAPGRGRGRRTDPFSPGSPSSPCERRRRPREEAALRRVPLRPEVLDSPGRLGLLRFPLTPPGPGGQDRVSACNKALITGVIAFPTWSPFGPSRPTAPWENRFGYQTARTYPSLLTRVVPVDGGGVGSLVSPCRL